ncbi:hypothetical protein WJX82_011611 [Trebouxia sp. C0006]
MTQQVTDAELAILEYGQIDLQDLLGDALTELQHCKELQFIDSRSAVLLQEKAHYAAAHADFVYTDLTQSSTQNTKDLLRDLAGKSWQRHIAVEERARLSEQVAAAARERAEIAEQRLAQRTDLAQERLQHATDLAQERHMAAAQKAAVTEQGLRSEIVSLQEVLQRAHAARFKERDDVSQELHEKLQTAQTDLRSAQTDLRTAQRQVAQRDARIAALEEICRHRDSSATPAKQAVEAMDAVGALVDQLDVTDTAAEAANQAPHAPAPVPPAAAVKADATKTAAAKEEEEQAHMADDAFALDTADAAVEMASLKEVEQQNDVHMDIEGKQVESKATAANPPAAAAAPAGKDPIAGALQRFGLKHPSRPVGVAKIDLASSFTDASSPAHALSAATSKPSPPGVVGAGKSAGQALPSGAGANKENEGQSAALACKAHPALQKPIPNPPATLNIRVTAAAAARKGDQPGKPTGSQPVLPAHRDSSQPVVANKRRILKPVNVNYFAGGKHQDVLPANMLFGDAFMVPKLRK